MTQHKIDEYESKSDIARIRAVNARTKEAIKDARESSKQSFDSGGGQVIITFLRDYGGFKAGKSQYLPRIQAQMLLDAGVAMDAAAYDALPEEKKSRLVYVERTASHP